eukprot:gene12778-biopygen496
MLVTAITTVITPIIATIVTWHNHRNRHNHYNWHNHRHRQNNHHRHGGEGHPSPAPCRARPRAVGASGRHPRVLRTTITQTIHPGGVPPPPFCKKVSGPAPSPSASPSHGASATVLQSGPGRGHWFDGFDGSARVVTGVAECQRAAPSSGFRHTCDKVSAGLRHTCDRARRCPQAFCRTCDRFFLSHTCVYGRPFQHCGQQRGAARLQAVAYTGAEWLQAHRQDPLGDVPESGKYLN